MERPRHLPFNGDGSRLRMGLRPLDPAEWLEVDGDLGEFLEHKRSVLGSLPGEVLAVVADPDGSVRDACQELLDALVDHLTVHHPDTHTRSGDRVAVLDDPAGVPVTPVALAGAGMHPVDAAGRLTQEDWAVQVRRRGEWVLAAASVCCPTRWVLTEKIGRSVGVVHQPVAGYPEQLEGAVDRFFDRITPTSPRWRLNWNLTDSTDLYQPGGKYRTEPVDDLDPEGVEDRIWLRVERQTLRCLPATGAVVFGIRIHQDPLRSLADRPEVLDRLARTIRSFPPGTLAHKSMGAFAPSVLEWIDRVVGTGPGGT